MSVCVAVCAEQVKQHYESSEFIKTVKSNSQTFKQWAEGRGELPVHHYEQPFSCCFHVAIYTQKSPFWCEQTCRATLKFAKNFPSAFPSRWVVSSYTDSFHLISIADILCFHRNTTKENETSLCAAHWVEKCKKFTITDVLVPLSSQTCSEWFFYST